MNNGRFITFEGSEGCGKSTQLELLAARLETEGHTVVVTREPGGTPLGEDIRHLLKHAASGQHMSHEAELLLFAASRAEHVQKVIRPALEKGHTILCDRFLDSTTVYQGVARKLSAETVAAVNAFAVDGCLPDLTLVLDMPAIEGMARAQKRHSAEPDRMESEKLAFYESVRQGFLDLANSSDRFAIVDATGSIERVAADIYTVLEQRLLV